MAHYLDEHIRLVRQKLGAHLRVVAVEHGLAGATPRSPALYLAMEHLLFELVQAYQTSFGPHAQAILNDVLHFTNAQPVLQISKVKIQSRLASC